MNIRRTTSKGVVLLMTIALLASAFTPLAVKRTLAKENTTPLTVSVPSVWQDVLTPDLLAQFEKQQSGVKVYVTYNNTSFFGFGPDNAAVSDQLDATEKAVTSADVVYVSPNSLTEADTQAGYFLDLTPLVNNDPSMNVSDFIPAAWQSYQWDNGIWALPLSVDVVLLTYDPAAFDKAGLAYPNDHWTIDDFNNAARKLTQYGANGTTVEIPGFSVVSGGNNQNLFLRTLAGASLFDSSTTPNAPKFASNTTLQHVLDVWSKMVTDGVVQARGGGRDNNIPLRVEGINGYEQRPNQTSTTTRNAVLLPGSVAGLNTQGFAVSAGTQYPELAYALASFLTSRTELANNGFSAFPARYSLAQTQSTTTSNTNTNPGGGPGGFFGGNRTIPDAIKPVVDQGLKAGLPVSELRYTAYLSTAVDDMTTNGTDSATALQTAETQATSDSQTATARAGTVALTVAPPSTGPVLAAGKIELKCAINEGFGGGFGGGSGTLPNQTQWDSLVSDFVANDPQVGAVVLDRTNETDLATLASKYDCFILPSNAVAGGDLSVLLSLDPLIDNDTTFDRNDVIGNTMAQLQQDSKTWALPLAVEPQMLRYDPQQFTKANVPAPTNGWSVADFVDALKALKPTSKDAAPFVPRDPSGSYLLMLVAAFGGLPVDYRTNPPTINYTDQATVDAIKQVLDLAVQGYISYNGLTTGTGGNFGPNNTAAITTGTLNQFNFRQNQTNTGNQNTTPRTLVSVMYPQGTKYSVASYTITTGYISATTQNPDATYRFLSDVARNPQLFNGMPARQSLVTNPVVATSQGTDVAALYTQLDTLLKNPNTIIFPSFGAGRGNITSFVEEYWLGKAFDNYVLNGKDLQTELQNAQTMTQAYEECAKNITTDTTLTAQQQRQQLIQQISQCATSVDPTFTIGG